MQQVSEAGSLACTRCGGRFERLSGAQAMFCPFCGQQHRLGTEFIAGLEAYRADVAQQLKSANAAYDEAAAYEPALRSLGGTRLLLYGSYASIVFVMLGAFSRTVDYAPAVGALQGLGWVGYALMAAVAGAGYYRAFVPRQPSKAPAPGRAMLGSVLVSCPSCGAPSELQPGQSADSCRYCRGVLVASDAIAARGRAQAALFQRVAQLEKRQQERRLWTRSTGLVAQSTTLGYATMVLLFIIIGVINVVQRPEERLELFLVFIVAAIVLVGIAILGWWRHRRPLKALARRLHGGFRAGTASVVAWLDAYWPAAYDVGYLAKQRCESLAAGMGGYPLLFHFMPAKNWLSPLPAHGDPSVNVLFACEFAGAIPTPMLWATPAVRPILEHCRSLGFAVESNDAGLAAIATPEFRTTLGRSLAELPGVAEVGAALYRIALALGARPPVR